ncbi:flavin reductase [uncultured Victivallis sp.]|uniref:flavin reductase family protein n=1 Tax=uncultured Victivallis sp. TaxID=354118 RepID=UPI0025E4A3BD|nr:flavin reductase [uncultured Victivallis sp.]
MPESENWKEIDPAEFACSSFRIWKDDWLVLAAGEFPNGKYNAMTVGWGFFGCMWAEPAVTVFLRPQRYTLEILDHCDTFTLSAFAPEYRRALTAIGRVSGREEPGKLAKAGLTAVRSARVEAPSFAEAELVLECRKLYRAEMSGRHFLDKSLIGRHYPERDYHVCVIGKVVRIAGDEKYLNPEALMKQYGGH